jgi:hypothetical protein
VESDPTIKDTALPETKPASGQGSVELSLGGEVRPSQDDPGAEEKTEKN